jgi:hypothetical protein
LTTDTLACNAKAEASGGGGRLESGWWIRLGRRRRRARIAACGPVSELAEVADELAQLADQAGALLDDDLRVGLELADARLGGLAAKPDRRIFSTSMDP